MKALMIASTELRNLDQIDDILALSGTGEYSDAEVLIEFAGRGCYQSWSRPNPETADTRDYVTKNILGKGHESVLEHATATFYITGVSRSLTHELIRHRHLSFSELSQRYVNVHDVAMVNPPLFREGMALVAPEMDAETREQHFQDNEYWKEAREGYGELMDEFTELFPDKSRKELREAARCVLPNATETKLSVTGNLRAWRHVIKMRGSLHADAEIRELAVELFRQLEAEYPSVFADMDVFTMPDGREFIGSV
jgi:thymidylate synthase (FAD)